MSSDSSSDDDSKHDDRFDGCAINFEQLVEDQKVETLKTKEKPITQADQRHFIGNSESSRKYFERLLDKVVCSQYDLETNIEFGQQDESSPPTPPQPIKIFDDSEPIMEIIESPKPQQKPCRPPKKIDNQMFEAAVSGVNDELFGFDPYSQK